MTSAPTRPILIVIRGDSGSGKSTVADGVQSRLLRGQCALISQDVVRREILRERDSLEGFTAPLIARMAEACLQAGKVVILEGVLNSTRYEDTLERLATTPGVASYFYAFDLSREEVLARHSLRAKSAQITREVVAGWYRGWQPLSFTDEVRISKDWSAEAIITRIVSDIGSSRSAA
ncbi:AAA domain-containing protein [Paraoerskovia marina]|uniref:AAA domain-containing protein n=1 Tax=Paraoerskovia marina TaxID=545619 RepID=A0A1H1PDV1_9CELL|nr:AAA family ATPase [Paraoerskovia marina]SDS09297.1 AAA domain-containing protein [Paraoerskovia marina]